MNRDNCPCEKQQKHYMIKKLLGDGCARISEYENPQSKLYTKEEAIKLAQRYASLNSERYGIFELIGAYEPVNNTQFVSPDDL